MENLKGKDAQYHQVITESEHDACFSSIQIHRWEQMPNFIDLLGPPSQEGKRKSKYQRKHVYIMADTTQMGFLLQYQLVKFMNAYLHKYLGALRRH